MKPQNLNDLKWHRKLDQRNFQICLYDNYFWSFLTVLRDLTAIPISESIFQFQNAIWPESRQWILIRILHLFLVPNFINSLSTSIVGQKFGTRLSIPNNVFKISVFSLLWVPNFITIRLCSKRGTKSAQIWNFGSSFEFQITYKN